MDDFYHDSIIQFKPLVRPVLGRINAGFKRCKLKEGEKYYSEYDGYNKMVFVLRGRLALYCSEVLGEVVHTGKFFFLPISARMSCEALTQCSFVVLFFDRCLNRCEDNYIRDLAPICYQNEFTFTLMSTRPLVQAFIRNTVNDAKQFCEIKEKEEYHAVKFEELFYLLRAVYSKEEMASLFYPIVGQSIYFRKFVLENYLKVKNIHGLVRISGMKRKTFDRQFIDEFRQTPHQWVLKQKSKHVRYALLETDDKMNEIMLRYGFTISTHFTRFCKDYLDNTPVELRKRLRLDRYSHIAGKTNIALSKFEGDLPV
ncbi:MAG: AraC family transcriptional regulator [Tannerellaceae bacterium]|jgi:AraC-like DNA-binding protein|nr:AraC family transcriptional regulator [Tannerellaceae bacterium]